MDDTQPTEPDEDNLSRESSDSADDAPPQIIRTGKPGRPVGYPKSGGRRKREPTDRDRIATALHKVAMGERRQVSGPTGKVYWSYPTHYEQLEASRILLNLAAAKEAAEAEPPLDEAAVRAALASYAPPPRTIAAAEPVPVEPIEPVTDADGFTHISDPAESRSLWTGKLSPPLPTATPTKDASRQDGFGGAYSMSRPPSINGMYSHRAMFTAQSKELRRRRPSFVSLRGVTHDDRYTLSHHRRSRPP